MKKTIPVRPTMCDTELAQSATKGHMKPIALDLCCGLGGWARGFIAEGWHIIGVADYPGEFVQADLLQWEGWRTIPARIVVSSTPCEQFSRWGMPWTRARNPSAPDLSLWKRAEFIAQSLDVPLIQENVRSAQQFVGRSCMNCGPFHLWGDVPALIPVFCGKPKGMYSSKQRTERAVVPIELARHIARVFRPLMG